MNESRLVSGCGDYDTQMLYFTCSSLSADDKRIYLIRTENGVPNVAVRDLTTGEERLLTDNKKGYMKAYVYFDGIPGEGLSKASVCLDSERDIVYYIQDNQIVKCGLDGKKQVLAGVPDGRMTAFMHVSADGGRLCVPMTDGRCLDYDPETEGSGLDKRPIYDIDERVQKENLSSYLMVYDTQTGEELLAERVEKAWITHVQFHPLDPEKILYNHEWASFDCGVRRMWLYDGHTGKHTRVRTASACAGDSRAESNRSEDKGTEGSSEGVMCRSGEDWVCHEMWSDDGSYIIYHGAFHNGPAFVGRVELDSMTYSEIALPEEYDAYGHFTMSHSGDLVCDGYYKMPGERKKVFENSTDNGPDPHKKDGAYISVQKADWEKKTLIWKPLCRHNSDWLGQDAHPHPIYSHKGDKIYFSSRPDKTVKVYCVEVE